MSDYDTSKFSSDLLYREGDWHRDIKGGNYTRTYTKKERIHNVEQRVEKLSAYIDLLRARVAELERAG